MRSEAELSEFIAAQRQREDLAALPLAGVRVIDMATVIAAPYAATLLGDYGAEVIKVENPSGPDATRGWGIVGDPPIQPFWSVVGRNKFPITLNLKTPEGRRVFVDLIRKADVLIENMRPGAMKKLGIEKDDLLAKNPGLVIGTVSGYGDSGPYADRPGFGTLAEGFSGFTFLNAQPDGPPTNAPMALADFVAGIHLAFAVMVALRHQERGAVGGQLIDVSLYEPLFGLLGPDFLTYHLTGEIPQPKGNELSYTAPRNNYATRDGHWVTMSCSAQRPFERLMECVGHPEMSADPRFSTNDARIKDPNRRILNQVIAEWVGGRDLQEVLGTCEQLGITIGPIASMEDIADDAHYQARQSVLDITDPATGTPLRVPNVPFRMDATPGSIRFPGLPMGSANEVIYRDLLGRSEGEIREMRMSGTI